MKEKIKMKWIKDDIDRLTEKLLKQDPSFKVEMDKADQAWDIAFQLYDLREKMGLTQTELAKLVGTKQSNIARIESADYTGYTLKTLEKVTKALKARLEIKIVPCVPTLSVGTWCNLADQENILSEHIAEALTYRAREEN